ncbi:MAG: hypothetical protein KBA51_02590 [Kiritimatiellae bacterium]|nr:hypothetical protein [Kiritimatiellia bacterium]
MKGWIFLPVALVAGLVLGGWGPRQEVRRLNSELALAQTPARSSGRATALGALGQVLPVATPERTEPLRPEPQPDADASAENPDAPEVEMESERVEPPDEETIRAGIDQAMEAWRLRSELVRNAFVANNALDASEAARFDTLVAAMNLRIRNDLQALADRLRADDSVTPEDGVRLINGLTSHLLQAYDDMDRAMPASWREASGEEFNLGDLVDPSVAEPLIGLEDRMRGPRGGPPWRRRP